MPESNPAEAVGTAVDSKTRGFQAVDITFYDKDPALEGAKEVEPLKPIRVSIKSDEIKKAAEDASTAPVVVHIEDDNTATEIENTASKADSAAIEIEKPGVEEENIVPENGSENNADDGTADGSVNFEADSFSIYAVVYTVDFHWEVDGKTFEFSIPGGGFISLQALVETLGIVDKDVSDVASKEFVEDVESVEFSNPELMWVGKVSHTTSVGTIKEEEKLEVQYSAELTESQIEKLNKTEVQAGDWALISMLPFESQETLTVTM